jgi:hypothetical protein
MPDIFIVVPPAFDCRGKRKHDRFDAHIRDTDELLQRDTAAIARPVCLASCKPLCRTNDIDHDNTPAPVCYVRKHPEQRFQPRGGHR